MKLINGDCLEEMDKLIEQGIKVDCIVTSPPYWKGFAYESYFNSYKQYLEWCDLWFKKIRKLSHNDTTIYINTMNDSEVTVRAVELLEVAQNNMFKLHDTIIWNRFNQQPANTDRQLTNQCEYIFMFRLFSAGIHLNKKEAYERNKDIFMTKNVGNVWNIPFNKGSKISFANKETKSKWGHSGFPVALPETCILLSTKEGDLVLDIFMGSGTTGVACKNLNRDFIGIELDEKYFNIAKERIENVKKK